jgi:hypothetical protein
MNTVSRKSPFVVVDRTDVAPTAEIPVERLEAAASQAQQAARANFSDAMEWAMTGVVLSGALLFGANLLRFIAPAGAVRDDGVACLFALAVVGDVLTAAIAFNGLWRLLRRSALGRG